MNNRVARTVALVVGILAVLGGLVWIGQGAGLIPGSFMTGDRTWLVIGIVVAAVGAYLIYLGTRRRR